MIKNKQTKTAEQERNEHLQRALRRWRQLTKYGKISVMLALLIVFNITWYLPLPTHAASFCMYLFWDPSSSYTLPSSWSVVTSVNGYFPRGAPLAGFSFPTTHTPNTAPANPGISSVTISGPSASVLSAGGGAGAAADTHTHSSPNTSTVTLGNDQNGDVPVYHSLQLIKYDNGGACGEPATIPAGGIAMFDQDPTTTTSTFTQYTANNNKVVKIDSTATTGGSDTETNTITIPALSAASGSGPTLGIGAVATATATHTHNAPTSLSCTSNCTSGSCAVNDISTPGTSTKFDCTETALPPYVSPMLYQATSDTPTLSVALTAMFDNDPGPGWQILSNSGGTYYQKYIRPAATADLTAHGTDTRAAITVQGTSGSANGGNGGNELNAGAGDSRQTHTHTITISTGTSANDNDPPYFDILIAQKVSFILQSYRWYVDPACSSSCSNDVSDPWPSGSLDLGNNTGLPAVPAPYLPPDAQNGTMLRLRVQILVKAQPLAANTIDFGLQYAKTSYNDCTSDAGSWTSMPAYGTAGAAWTYGTDNVNDSSTLTSSVFGSDVKELFMRSVPGSGNTNPNATTAPGQTIEYDWLIMDKGATGGTQYAFRPVEINPTTGDVTLLSYYGTTVGPPGGPNINTTCPIIITKPTVDQELRGGEFFQTNTYSGGSGQVDPDQGFEWAD